MLSGGLMLAGINRTGKEPMTKNLKPGQPAPNSGEYEIRGPRGGDTGQERTAIQGKPLPPTPKPGQSYTLHRPAHNGAGKKR
jgi:hypothetical protein